MKSILFALALTMGTPDGNLVIKDNDHPAPVPTIVTQDQVKPGRVISVKVGELGALPANLYSVTYTWMVHPAVPDLQVDRLDGTMAWFGSGEDGDNYNVTLIATYSYPDWEAKKLVTRQTTGEKLIICRRDPGPVKPVNPVDPVKPVDPPKPAKPTFPDGTFKLSQLTYDTVLTVPLPADKRNEQALALAKNYRNVISAITSATQAGATMTPNQIISMTVDANVATLGADAPSWTPAMSVIAQAANAQKAKLLKADDWQTAWTEIAIALEAFKQ